MRDADGINAAIGAHHIREDAPCSFSNRARDGKLVMSFVTSLGAESWNGSSASGWRARGVVDHEWCCQSRA